MKSLSLVRRSLLLAATLATAAPVFNRPAAGSNLAAEAVALST